MKKSRGPRQPGGGRKTAGPRHRGRPAAPRHGDARGEHGQRGERERRARRPAAHRSGRARGVGPGMAAGRTPKRETGIVPLRTVTPMREGARNEGAAPGRASFKTRPGRGPRHGKRPDAEAGNRDRPAADRYAEARGNAERGAMHRAAHHLSRARAVDPGTAAAGTRPKQETGIVPPWTVTPNGDRNATRRAAGAARGPHRSKRASGARLRTRHKRAMRLRCPPASRPSR